MNRPRFLIAVILVAGATLLYLQLGHRGPSARDQAVAPASSDANQSNPPPQKQALARTSSSAAPNPAAQEPVAADATTAAAKSTPPAPPPAAPVPDTAESSSLPGATVLDNMRVTIRQFASAFGENPVGTNPEITGALQGDNPKHINFLKADGNRVNAKGELVDVWGTPYFFHQISGHEMEVRSAGPDRVMYTGDDLVTR